MKTGAHVTDRSGRVKTPTLLQMEAVECGAAALGTVLGYFGRYVPLEELRLACGVSRDGVSAKNVVQAARTFGLDARGYRKKLDDLRGLQFPAILFWKFEHFLVLEGFKGDTVFLNDPATGPRTIHWSELDEGFTGVVLLFEPGPEFKPGGSPPGLIEPLLERLAGSRRAIAFAVLAGLALVVPGLVLPIFAQVFVDKYLVAGLQDWMRPLLFGMALTAILRGLLTWLREKYLLRLRTKLDVTMSSRFFWHVLRLPVEFFTQRSSGDISTRVGLNDEIADLLSGQFATTVIDVLMIVFFALLMLLYDWMLTLIVVLIAAVNLLVMRAMARRRTDGNLRLRQEEGRFAGALIGGLQNIETLKATSREDDFFTTLAGHQATLMNTSQDLAVRTEILEAAPPLTTKLAATMILVLGGLRVMQGDLTMGMLVAFQSLMASFYAPVDRLISLGARLQEMQGNMARLDDVQRYPVDPQTTVPQEVAEVPDGMDLLTGRVGLQNVTFGYSRLGAPLIEDFSMALDPGARVALVGSSGSGKSTLSRLICGLYEPWQGEIRFDGRLRHDLPRETVTGSLKMVDQEIVLFEGSVRENLTLWDETVPEYRLIRACKDACIHEEITGRQDGYDSRIEEGGTNLSGGQRQRLEIARALVDNPSILVLDEATSALDPVTEKRIDENLRKRGCTCIIVAHRLSTIRDCDEIIVLDQGQVAQRGTHEELIAQTDGAYAQLVKG